MSAHAQCRVHYIYHVEFHFRSKKFQVNFSGVKSRSCLHIAIFYLEKKKIDKFWKFNDFSQFLSANKKLGILWKKRNSSTLAIFKDNEV